MFIKNHFAFIQVAFKWNCPLSPNPFRQIKNKVNVHFGACIYIRINKINNVVNKLSDIYPCSSASATTCSTAKQLFTFISLPSAKS